jgi:isoleucyl-tRNA synthetase
LPCNKAIAFNPNLKYGLLINPNDKVYLIANDLIETAQNNIPILKESIRHESIIDGNSLSNLFYSSIFSETLLPVLPSEHVGNKQGTGLVHIAPALGQDDFKIGIKHNLTTDCVIDEKGKYSNDDHVLNKFQLNGKSVLDETTFKEIENILADSILFKHDHIHSYPYDWRTKKPCIIRSSMQWFIDTNKLKHESLAKLKNVKIRPSNVTNSMNATLMSRPYWCISRQRSWGLPIPCFFFEKEPIINDDFISKLKELTKSEGNIDFWWTNKHDDELKNSLKLKTLNSDLTKSNDIFDIWFDSGSSFSGVLNENQVADLYCEGVDQFSGWFQSSLLLSIAYKNKAPYKNILVHGYKKNSFISLF